MGEVQEVGTQHLRFFASVQIGRCSDGGTGLVPAAAYSAAPILRTAAATEVADGPNDGGWGGAVVPQRKRYPFCNHGAQRGAVAWDFDREGDFDVVPGGGHLTQERNPFFD